MWKDENINNIYDAKRKPVAIKIKKNKSKKEFFFFGNKKLVNLNQS